MRLFCTSIFLSSLIWLGTFGSVAQGLPPKVIKTDGGATLVFNTQESFFALDIVGDEIKPAPGTEGYIQVDARLLRAVSIPDHKVLPTAGQQVMLGRELLQAQQRIDLDEEQFSLQRPVRDVKQEYMTTSKGRQLLHWWFALPGAAERGVLERHYFSTVCNRQVLVLCAPLLAGDTPGGLKDFLLQAAASVRESDDPIDIKEYAKTLRESDDK